MSSNKFELFITSEAEAEVLEAFLWYESRQTGLGSRFEKEVLETLNRVQVDPHSFTQVHGVKRRAGINHFPYGVYFQINGTEIFILAVVSYLRHPDVWKTK